MFNRRVLSLALVGVAMAGCASIGAPVSITETVAQTPSLSTFNGLMVQSGLSSTLQGTGPYTVFAPSNDAFKLVPAKTMDDLSKHPDKLKNVLAFHILGAKVMAADVNNSSAKTLNGANVALSRAGDFVTIEDAVVQRADLQASNGVIHIIDSVLTAPPKK